MNAKSKSNAQDAKQPDIKQVTDFLRLTPNFFADKPELLKQQQLHPDATGEDQPVSLQQRQLELLRQQLAEQSRHMQQLTSTAISNEKLLNRWHDLTLELMTSDSTDEFFELLQQRLQSDFNADHVVLCLSRDFKLDADIASNGMLKVAEQQDDAVMLEILALSEPYCGRLTRSKQTALFADADVGSAAVVAVAPFGALAIGSKDTDRFAPGMGVLFIDLLGKTVHWRLQQHAKQIRKQA